MRTLLRWWREFVEFTDEDEAAEPLWAWLIRVGTGLVVLTLALSHLLADCR